MEFFIRKGASFFLVCPYSLHNISWEAVQVIMIIGSGARMPGFKSWFGILQAV